MSNHLEGYKKYYQLRMQRYENRPEYSRSYVAEKAIYEAIASCNTIDEFKDKLGNLNEKNATALAMDEYEIRLEHYESMNETVKANGCRRILEKIKDIADVQQLMTIINEENNQLNLDITADSIYPFPETGWLERYEMWKDAEVPGKFRKQYDEYAEEERSGLKQAWQMATQEIQNFQPGWTFDFERILEERHLRLLPVPVGIVREQIAFTKKLLQ